MRHLRFRMRTMFVLVTVAAVCYAASLSQVQRQRVAVAEIWRLGGHVQYEASAYDAEPLRIVPWLTAAFGPDCFHSVDGVLLPRTTDESIALLQALPETKKLSLRNVLLSNSGLKHLTAMSQLESLQLDRGRLDDACMNSLAALTHLKHLEVRGATLTDGSIGVISQLPAIQSVLLTDCRLTDRGLDAFRNSSKITWLGLCGTKLPKASAAIFSTMPNLEELHLGDQSIGDKGLERLAGIRTISYRKSEAAASTLLLSTSAAP